jgi:hypothetical protein
VARVRIENRSQLIYLLTEAAELEHGILCCYLFASFSLKDSTAEGVSEEQLSSMREWRALVREISLQEMLHLASVCNLLTAVGGAPQLRRPNLPTSPRAYPTNFQLRLAPFGLDALEQFIAIEKPVSLIEEREEALADLSLGKLSDIFSSERSYDTQGHLYRGIEDGLVYLAQKYGDEKLFVGAPGHQTADKYFNLPDLYEIRDLDSALATTKVIVEQGEGASIEVEDSHYKRFLRIYEDYRSILARDPSFNPARPVLPNPYAIAPNDVPAGDINMITDPLAANVCNLFDGCYEIMIQMLGRLFVHAEESEADLRALAGTTAAMMLDVLLPLGSALTLMPSGRPGFTAGPSFRLSRGASIPTHRLAARIIFNERLLELAAYCRFLEAERGAPPALSQVREALSRFAASFAGS